jgi:hypothetical protein
VSITATIREGRPALCTQGFNLSCPLGVQNGVTVPSRRATSRDEHRFEAVIAARGGLAPRRDNFAAFVDKHRAIVVRAGAKSESRLREARQCEARVRGIQATNVSHAGCTKSSSHNGARVSGRFKRPHPQ